MSWLSIRKNLWMNKEGLVGGAAVGLLAAYYAKWKGIDLSFTLSSQGLFDSWATTLTPDQLAFWKYAIVLAFTGALIGYFIDSLLPEMTWKRIKKAITR